MHTQFSLGERHDTAHGIDLAPMLDFVTNLLIFFIVAAGRAPMGTLIGVVDQVRLGGIYDITFTTTE